MTIATVPAVGPGVRAALLYRYLAAASLDMQPQIDIQVREGSDLCPSDLRQLTELPRGCIGIILKSTDEPS
jgi:hypothetical protein